MLTKCLLFPAIIGILGVPNGETTEPLVFTNFDDASLAVTTPLYTEPSMVKRRLLTKENVVKTAVKKKVGAVKNVVKTAVKKKVRAVKKEVSNELVNTLIENPELIPLMWKSLTSFRQQHKWID